MRIQMLPFQGSVEVKVRVEPMTWALFAGKLHGLVPPHVPDEGVEITVFIDTPHEDQEEAMEFVMLNRTWIRNRVREVLIAPVFLN